MHGNICSNNAEQSKTVRIAGYFQYWSVVASGFIRASLTLTHTEADVFYT